MTDAPETIWAAPPWDDEAWESGAGEWDVSGGWAVDRKVEYTRADIHDIAQARIAELEAALTALMEINDNHSPFGGEIYWDRVERTWDAARAALKAKP